MHFLGSFVIVQLVSDVFLLVVRSFNVDEVAELAIHFFTATFYNIVCVIYFRTLQIVVVYCKARLSWQGLRIEVRRNRRVDPHVVFIRMIKALRNGLES